MDSKLKELNRSDSRARKFGQPCPAGAAVFLGLVGHRPAMPPYTIQVMPLCSRPLYCSPLIAQSLHPCMFRVCPGAAASDTDILVPL